MTNLADIDFAHGLRDQPPIVIEFAREVAQLMPPGSWIDAHISNGNIAVFTRAGEKMVGYAAKTGTTPRDVADRLKAYAFHAEKR